MDEYKKRVRQLAERHGFEVDYGFDGTLSLNNSCGTVKFSPTKRSDMICTIANANHSFALHLKKKLIFDIIHRLGTGRALDGYNPKGEPLTIQEYVSEEHQVHVYPKGLERNGTRLLVSRRMNDTRRPCMSSQGSNSY